MSYNTNSPHTPLTLHNVFSINSSVYQLAIYYIGTCSWRSICHLFTQVPTCYICEQVSQLTKDSRFRCDAKTACFVILLSKKRVMTMTMKNFCNILFGNNSMKGSKFPCSNLKILAVVYIGDIVVLTFWVVRDNTD